MSRGTIVGYAILILVVMFVGQNLFHQLGGYKEQIKAAEAEKKEMTAHRDELQRKVAELTAEQTKLQKTITEKEGTISKLRQDVGELERKLKDDRSEIVRIQTDDDSMVRFAKEFPEFSLGMRMVERQVQSTKHPDKIIPMNYIMLPVGFVDHFIDLKKTAASLGEQKQKLTQMDALNTQVKALQEDIIRLGREKEDAYHKGYEEAFAKYMQLSDDYLKLMKEKRFSVGTSLYQAAGAFIGGLAIGVGL